MNYFIDFEATQFSNEIIAIGCVRSNGDTFYEEVRAKKKITPFITSLTGITDVQNKVAPSSDEVFNKFFDWISQYPDERAIFYCYGNSDLDFVKKNLILSQNIWAQAALSIIGMNLYDYSKTVKEHFGLIKNISLVKIIAYYRGVDSIHQIHNALEDALYLKEVYDNVSNENKVEGHPFPDYEADNYAAIKKEKTNKETNQSPRNILRSLKHKVLMYNDTGEILEQTFYNIGEARAYIISKLGPIDKAKANKAKIDNKIINAHKKKISYNGHKWNIIVLEKLEGDKE